MSRSDVKIQIMVERNIFRSASSISYGGVLEKNGWYPQLSSIFRWIFHEINHPASLGYPRVSQECQSHQLSYQLNMGLVEKKINLDISEFSSL